MMKIKSVVLGSKRFKKDTITTLTRIFKRTKFSMTKTSREREVFNKFITSSWKKFVYKLIVSFYLIAPIFL